MDAFATPSTTPSRDGDSASRLARAFDAGPAAMSFARRPRTTPRVLPGFGLSLGITVTYLSLIVLIPLSAAFVKVVPMSPVILLPR
jgi:hypothetical protein